MKKFYSIDTENILEDYTIRSIYDHLDYLLGFDHIMPSGIYSCTLNGESFNFIFDKSRPEIVKDLETNETIPLRYMFDIEGIKVPFCIINDGGYSKVVTLDITEKKQNGKVIVISEFENSNNIKLDNEYPRLRRGI